MNAGSTLRAGINIAVTSGTNPFTLSGTISGTGQLIKEGANIVTLSGANTYTGSTTVNEGTLRLGAANAIPSGSNVTIGAGTLSTGGFSQTLNTPLALSSAATLDLGAGASTVHFATSDIATLWNFNTLTVNNWTPVADHLFFGSTASGLGASPNLNLINFGSHPPGARILSTGEVIPVLSLVHGDVNQDGSITGADITAMLQALNNVNAFENAYAMSASDISTILDFTGDGKLTNLDIQGELDLVATSGGGSLAAVPEPGSLLLLACGGLAIWAPRLRRRK